MRKFFIRMMAVAGIGSAAACSSAQGYDDMDVAQFARYIEGDVQLLDVRTPEEFAAGHLKDAININWQSPDFDKTALKTLSKDRPVAVYCRSGKRSAAAAVLLAKDGYEVTNLQGGILAWESDRQPVVK